MISHSSGAVTPRTMRRQIKANIGAAQGMDRNRGDQNWDQRNDSRNDGRGVNTDRGRGDSRANDDRGRGGDDWNRNDRRGDRNDNRWNDTRSNGYTYNGRWYYGPPPAGYYGYEPGYRAWRRGDRLPAYYRSSYREVDWRYNHLRPPPRGYHWVRDDRGEYLLVALTTGIILGAILNNGY